MQLSLPTDYALRVLMYLVSIDTRAAVGEIADFYQISNHHLAKVAQRLSREGYVRSIRGIGGGIELARSADSISVGEVVATFEGTTDLLECVSATQTVCVLQPSCGLRGVLAEAQKLQMDYLNSVSLDQLATPGRALHRISLSD